MTGSTVKKTLRHPTKVVTDPKEIFYKGSLTQKALKGAKKMIPKTPEMPEMDISEPAPLSPPAAPPAPMILEGLAKKRPRRRGRGRGATILAGRLMSKRGKALLGE